MNGFEGAGIVVGSILQEGRGEILRRGIGIEGDRDGDD